MNNLDNYTPKYIQIKNYILGKIENGEYKAGNKIPSENLLAEQFNVSRITANCAIKELSNIGIVERIRGKGTFIKENNDQTPLAMVFLDNIKLADITLGSKKHSLLKQGIIEPTNEIKNKLSLGDSELVYEVVRLMFDNNIPTSIDYTYMPLSIFGNQIIDVPDIGDIYIHEYLKENLKCNIKYVNIYINTKVLSNYELSMLHAKKEDKFTIWDTNILDENRNLIAITTTLSKANISKPFITFEI